MPENKLSEELLKPINDALDKEYKRIFKPYIDPNYLITTREELMDNSSFLLAFENNFSNIFQRSTRLVDNDNFIYESCKYIAMIHYYFNIPYAIFPKDKDMYLTDDIHKKKIFEYATIELKLKKDFNLLNETYSLNAYMPLNYILRSITHHLMKIVGEFDSRKNKIDLPNEAFKMNSIFNMLVNINGILTLCESGDYAGSSALLRILVQIYATYEAIGDNVKASEAYYKFCQWSDENTKNEKYPDEFTQIEPHLKCGKGRGQIQFLMFGWLDALGDKHKEYSMSGLFMYVSTANRKMLDKIYKECNKFIHGQYMHKDFDDKFYMHSLAQVGGILKLICLDVSNFIQEPLISSGVDLLKELDKILEENDLLFSQYNNKKTEYKKSLISKTQDSTKKIK